MRSKEEALINPANGDKWEKVSRGKLYVFFLKRVQALAEGGEIIYTDGFGQICATTTPAFRRWAANAEYLGGAE